MKNVLAPSILSADFKVLGEQLKVTVATIHGRSSKKPSSFKIYPKRYRITEVFISFPHYSIIS